MITLCDTGPLIAALNRRDPLHAWALALARQVPAPWFTCEPVLTEAVYFLREYGAPVEPLFELIERGAIKLDFDLDLHWGRLRTLMRRYANMDLADACLVVMVEAHRRCQVLTVDAKDFSIYRRNDRQVIDFVSPPR